MEIQFAVAYKDLFQETNQSRYVCWTLRVFTFQALVAIYIVQMILITGLWFFVVYYRDTLSFLPGCVVEKN